MPSYGSRADKFVLMDGAALTTVEAPLVSSAMASAFQSQKIDPEGFTRPLEVQVGLSDKTLTLEGYVGSGTAAAGRILESEASGRAVAHQISYGTHGDAIGQPTTACRSMVIADGWKLIPGELLLQFAGTLRPGAGGLDDVVYPTVVRERSRTVARSNDQNHAAIQSRLVPLGAGASTQGFVVVYHVARVEFADHTTLRLGLSHAASRTAAAPDVPRAKVEIKTVGGLDAGPLAFWRVTTGAARAFVAPTFHFTGGTQQTPAVTYHCAVSRR